MPRVALAALAVLLATSSVAATPPIADVTITRDGQDWTADYRFHRRAPAWVFVKSVLPRVSRRSWRIGTVTVLTPGVSLQRLGNYDALVARAGAVPARVRLRFTPYREDIEAGYDPALAFADGSVALYADQFTMVSFRSAAAARAADGAERGLGDRSRPTRMTFVDRAGPVLAHGRRTARAQLDDGATYVLFGRAKPMIGPAMTTIMDPALPRWIPDYLNAELPKVLGRYRTQLGPSPVGQPTLMVSWAGATPAEPNHVSLGGSVLPGIVVMTLSGSKLLQPSDRVAQYARWFVSHEAAHFWLGQAVSYATPAESWITEGGAELLAFRATAAADPTFDVGKRLAEAKSECAPFLAVGGVASAYQRPGDSRAYYACGALFALAAERANGGDFPGFVRDLIAGPGKDGVVTRPEWLALLDRRAGNRRSSAAIVDLLDHAHAQPAAALDRFVADTGIANDFALPALNRR
jgi:hypothetical protein